MTTREAELYKQLRHAVMCFDGECRKCLDIETRMEDGAQHFLDDPDERFRRLDIVLGLVLDQARRVESYLEVAPVPASARQAAFELTDMTRTAQRLLVEPLYSNKPKRRRVRRRAVTLIVLSGGKNGT